MTSGAEESTYRVSILFDACTGIEVKATSPEEAAQRAYDDDRSSVILCHQCSDEIEVGDAIQVIVYDESGMKELLDDGLDTAIIKQQKERIAGLEAEVSNIKYQAQFQGRVVPWFFECFGGMAANNTVDRNRRFIEEALELVQACGMPQSEAHQLVDYVYSRPLGEPEQEVGGVMVSLAVLCFANGLDMHTNGETELARVWTKIEQIRAKQAAKPKHSPLPE